jgi:hypothetical protein
MKRSRLLLGFEIGFAGVDGGGPGSDGAACGSSSTGS